MIQGNLTPPGAMVTTKTYAKLYVTNIFDGNFKSQTFRDVICMYQDPPEIIHILLYAKTGDLNTEDMYCFSNKACQYKVVVIAG